MFGALFILSAIVPPHPLTAFGPPGPATPEVKPDWYLMWVYGFLKIVPPWASFSLFGATIGPNFLGGMLFPAALFGVLTLTPWIDRTNRHVVCRFWLESSPGSPPRERRRVSGSTRARVPYRSRRSRSLTRRG